MKSVTLAAALLVPLGSAFTLFAGAPYEALDAGDVFVATITRVQDKDATNARPPRVWLNVHEVIRGEAKMVRSPALWSPPFHGIDWGDGNQPELKRWYAAPLKGPKVGQKFILGGKLFKLAPDEDEKDAPNYYLFDFVRIPYSDEARTKTIAHLAALDVERRKYAAELAAAAKERELRGQKWRAALTDRVIDQRTQEADIVAIGQITSGAGYEFETMLKGQPRGSTGAKYFVTLPSDGYDPRIADIVYQRPRCILFLSEQNLIVSVTGIQAQLIDPYEGIVLADAAAIAAVKASLAKRPAPKPKPVLVISALDRADAAPLAQAARATFVVVNSHQFSGHGNNSIDHVRNTIPHAAFLVMIDRGPDRRVRAVQITPDAADTLNTLYDATWPEKDAPEQLQALMKVLMKKLVEKTN
jgi:hypothetical protein